MSSKFGTEFQSKAARCAVLVRGKAMRVNGQVEKCYLDKDLLTLCAWAGGAESSPASVSAMRAV